MINFANAFCCSIFLCSSISSSDELDIFFSHNTELHFVTEDQKKETITSHEILLMRLVLRSLLKTYLEHHLKNIRTLTLCSKVRLVELCVQNKLSFGSIIEVPLK